MPRYRFLGGPLDPPVSRSSHSFPSFDLFHRKLQARSSFGARARPVIRPDRRGLDHRTTRPRGPVTPPRALFERSYGLLSHSMARLHAKPCRRKDCRTINGFFAAFLDGARKSGRDVKREFLNASGTIARDYAVVAPFHDPGPGSMLKLRCVDQDRGRP